MDEIFNKQIKAAWEEQGVETVACPKCGGWWRKGVSNFCGYCGVKLEQNNLSLNATEKAR